MTDQQMEETGAAQPDVHACLDEAMRGLQDTYSHPHHRGRLEQIKSHMRMLHGFVDDLAQSEENRAHRVKELLELNRKRQLPGTLPSHDEELLEQELGGND